MPAHPGDSGIRRHTDRRCGRGSRRCGTARHAVRGQGLDSPDAQIRFRNRRRPDRLSGKVFHHIGRTGESPRAATPSEPRRRTAMRRDRRATPDSRMHEDAERRRPQPLGAHRPLLERQIGLVGRRNRAPPIVRQPRRSHICTSCRADLRGRTARSAASAGNAAMARSPPGRRAAPDFAGSPEGPGGAASLSPNANPPRRMRPCGASAAARSSGFKASAGCGCRQGCGRL